MLVIICNEYNECEHNFHKHFPTWADETDSVDFHKSDDTNISLILIYFRNSNLVFKMLSKRCYMIFRLLNLFRLMGAISLSFDTEKLLLKNYTSSSSKRFLLLQLSFSLNLVWGACTVTKCLKLYLLGHTDFYVVYVLSLCGALVTTMFTVNFLFSQELCELANNILQFLRYFHSKCLSFLFKRHSIFVRNSLMSNQISYIKQKRTFQILTRKKIYSISSSTRLSFYL